MSGDSLLSNADIFVAHPTMQTHGHHVILRLSGPRGSLTCPKKREIHLCVGCKDEGQGRLGPTPASLWRPAAKENGGQRRRESQAFAEVST